MDSFPEKFSKSVHRFKSNILNYDIKHGLFDTIYGLIDFKHGLLDFNFQAWIA